VPVLLTEAHFRVHFTSASRRRSTSEPRESDPWRSDRTRFNPHGTGRSPGGSQRATLQSHDRPTRTTAPGHPVHLGDPRTPCSRGPGAAALPLDSVRGRAQVLSRRVRTRGAASAAQDRAQTHVLRLLLTLAV